MSEGTEERRQAELIAEHSRLMQRGFPQPQTSEFWEKVEALPAPDGIVVRKLCDLSRALRKALSPK